MVLPLPHLLLLALTHIVLLLSSAAAAATDYYLKLPLLHRTPFTPPSHSLSSDTHRLSLLFSTLNPHSVKAPLVSGAPTGSGQYFVDFSVGTPPQKLLLVADTGSDLVWVKCSACLDCAAHPQGSAFLPRHSSSFSPFHCYDRACRLVPHRDRACNRTRLHSTCRYDYTYGDGSTTSGFFSRETTRLNTSSGREARLRNLAFGCGFEASGPSVTGASFNGASGVMGLGRGAISFSTQLGKRFGNKFSYCLMDYTLSPPPTSYLMIGKPGSGPDSNKPESRKIKMCYTPLLTNLLSPTFYYIGIKSVIVNGVQLRIDPSLWTFDSSGNGGTVIDSGTTLTFFADAAYRHIVSAIKHRVGYPRVEDPTLSFEYCINATGPGKLSLPRLSFRLVGGSVFSPPATNYFIDTAYGVKCLALQPVNSPSGFSVIGNLMQQGFLFEFDREKSRLGFTRRGCSLS